MSSLCASYLKVNNMDNSTKWEFIFREFVYLRGYMRWPPLTLHLVIKCYETL